ncbi:sterol desaturase family protein [Sandaracinobacter neustonicus]|uniref:Sterol desaturase family protein n=1 Tax=Sandaracinobacter neustonicus TaxID=1715348 RepID=A0A501XS67_9SPHN|nr:sterol desaturase family protein [Sandaracinobacter neustonicus]TPE63602.1 sterol desaturase family protein [Sandaracinobacter neustonicus]
MQTAVPTTALWVSLAGMCLIVAVRYLAISGLFAWSAKKIRPDIYAPADPKKAARMARQVKREIAWSLSAAVLYGLPAGLAAHLWATRGLTEIYVDPNAYPLWWIPVSVLLYLAIHDTWFYWTHRAMHHWPWLFKKAHAVHHESRPPTAWAAMAFHPWESLTAAWLIPALTFVIPIHIAALGVVLTIMTFFGVTNHMGWEIFPRRWIEGWFGRHFISASHHHVHHERYMSNYGLYFRFWDKLCGTDKGLSPELLAAKDAAFKAPQPQ